MHSYRWGSCSQWVFYTDLPPIILTSLFLPSHLHTSTTLTASQHSYLHTQHTNGPDAIKQCFYSRWSLIKQAYMTPDLYGQPSLGKALASSTPTSPRTRAFPQNQFHLNWDLTHCPLTGRAKVMWLLPDWTSSVSPKWPPVGNCSLAGTVWVVWEELLISGQHLLLLGGASPIQHQWCH